MGNTIYSPRPHLRREKKVNSYASKKAYLSSIACCARVFANSKLPPKLMSGIT